MAVDHNNPQSRNEEILIATIDGNEYNKAPQSRMEELLLELKETIEEGGGGGGTSDYENLSNQPQVNGETLIGDKSGADLGLVDAVEGKDLSTNDYDDNEKAAVAAATSAISAMKDGTDLDSFGDVEVALLDKADTADLGTAAAKNSINAVTAGSTDLVESGAVKDAIDVAVAAAYHHAGTKTVAQLTHDLLIAANEGNVYNITDSGTTTSDFIEGIGKTIDEGSNVGICKVGNAYMFDLLSGFVDTTNFVQKSVTAGLLKNDGTVNDEIEDDVDQLKSGLTDLDNEVNGDATTYPYADVITIEDAVPANLADCSVKVEPVQDLHGYDKPWVGGAGKNKWVGTFVNDGFDQSDTYSQNRNKAGNVETPVIAGQKYAFSINGEKMQIRYIFLDENKADIGNYTNGITTVAAPSDAKYLKWRSLNDVGSQDVKAQLEIGETATSYEPYTNICPISGHTEAVVTQNSKNIFRFYPNNKSEITVQASGTTSGPGKEFTGLIPAGTYTFKNWAGNPVYVMFSTSDFNHAVNVGSSYTFSYNGSGYLRFQYANITTTTTFKAQLESGSMATDYVPYVNNQYTLALGDTIYGGTVDFDSGVMTVTHGVVDLGDLTYSYDSSVRRFGAVVSDLKQVPSRTLPMVCSCYEVIDDGRAIEYVTDNSIYTINNYIEIHDYRYTVPSDLATELDGQTLVYPLAEPFTVQLTPQQIQLLQGTNTLYAFTGDISVSVNGVSGAIGGLTSGKQDKTDYALETTAKTVVGAINELLARPSYIYNIEQPQSVSDLVGKFMVVGKICFFQLSATKTNTSYNLGVIRGVNCLVEGVVAYDNVNDVPVHIINDPNTTAVAFQIKSGATYTNPTVISGLFFLA